MKNSAVSRKPDVSFFLPFLICMTLFLIFSADAAVAVPEFLSGIESKITELTTFFSGTLAKAIITLVIIFFGFMSLTGRINKVFGFGIVGGALFISFSSQIAEWVIN
ncbi:TrbC/VirB2 family protein [bacterium]|nr:TrbC/VirB2 family protein [bacterium]